MECHLKIKNQHKAQICQKKKLGRFKVATVKVFLRNTFLVLTAFSLPQLQAIFGLCCSAQPFFVAGLLLLPHQGMVREIRVWKLCLSVCGAAFKHTRDLRWTSNWKGYKSIPNLVQWLWGLFNSKSRQSNDFDLIMAPDVNDLAKFSLLCTPWVSVQHLMLIGKIADESFHSKPHVETSWRLKSEDHHCHWNPQSLSNLQKRYQMLCWFTSVVLDEKSRDDTKAHYTSWQSVYKHSKCWTTQHCAQTEVMI